MTHSPLLHSPWLLFALIGMSCSPLASGAGELFKWVDAAGVTHFSQEKPETTAKLEVIVYTRDRPIRSASNRAEELDRIRRLTQQLVEERLTRERQRLEQDRLALDRAWLRQREWRAQRLSHQQDYSRDERGAANHGGFNHYSVYRIPGHPDYGDRQHYRYGAKNRGAWFGFATRRSRAAVFVRDGRSNGRGAARPPSERRSHGEGYRHGNGHRSTSSRRVNRSRAARPPRAMRSRGLAPRRATARGLGSGLSPRIARRR